MPFCRTKPKASASGFRGLRGAPEMGAMEWTGEEWGLFSVVGEEVGEDQIQESQEPFDVVDLGVAGPASETVEDETVE